MATTRKRSSGFAPKEEVADTSNFTVEITEELPTEVEEKAPVPVVFEETLPEPPAPAPAPAPVVKPAAVIKPPVLNPPPRRHPRNIPKFSRHS